VKRAAIYARYSTALQADRSAEDQITLCRGYAAGKGLDIVEVYSDRAQSGASVTARAGLEKR
jgi:site-specific DNA recombinase